MNPPMGRFLGDTDRILIWKAGNQERIGVAGAGDSGRAGIAGSAIISDY